MTNGEKIQQMFSDGNYEYIRKLSGMNRYEITSSELYYPLSFSEDWWNGEYKEAESEET